MVPWHAIAARPIPTGLRAWSRRLPPQATRRLDGGGGFPATLPHALETGTASQATSYAKPTREAHE